MAQDEEEEVLPLSPLSPDGSILLPGEAGDAGDAGEALEPIEPILSDDVRISVEPEEQVTRREF